MLTGTRAIILDNAASMGAMGLRAAFVPRADNDDQTGETDNPDTHDLNPPEGGRTRADLERFFNDVLVFISVGMPDTAEGMVDEAIFDGRFPGHKSTLVDFKEKMHNMPRCELSSSPSALHASFFENAWGVSSENFAPARLERNRRTRAYPAPMPFSPSLYAA